MKRNGSYLLITCFAGRLVYGNVGVNDVTVVVVLSI